MKALGWGKSLMAVCTVIFAIPITAQAQTIWDGTADVSWYNTSETSFTITTAEQLAGLAQIVNGTASGMSEDDFTGKTITLGSNIALNNTTNWQNWGNVAPANSWTAIGTTRFAREFAGTFDGAGFVISGVYINSSSVQGLFGNIVSGGTIKNLGVTASYVKGNTNVGGLVGANVLGTITNCYSTGNVVGDNIGIDRNVGGLVGFNSGTITNSYATGTVQVMWRSGSNSSVGGLVGSHVLGAITNSYATGNVLGVGSGGLVGETGNGAITNSYYNSSTDGAGSRGTPKTEAEMRSEAFVASLNYVAFNISAN